MYATVLRMISNNTLSAFSAATTSPAGRPPVGAPAAASPASPIRLVREPAAATKTFTAPVSPPTIAPPRGSLLNLSV